MFEKKAQLISDALWGLKYQRVELEKFRKYVQFANSDQCGSATLSFGFNSLEKNGEEKSIYAWNNVKLDAHKEVILGMLKAQLSLEEDRLKERESDLKSLVGGLDAE